MGDVTDIRATVETLAERYQRAALKHPEIAREEDRLRQAQAEERRLKIERMARAGLRLDDDDLELVLASRLEPNEALLALSAWWADPKAPAMLVLSGGTGRGKSLALAELASRTTSRYAGAERLCRVFSGNFGDSVEEQDKLLNCGLLLLDDVGTETDHTRMQSTLLEVLEARKSRVNHPTVVTTNLAKKAFAEVFGNERLHSRMNRVRWVSLKGEDYRRKR